ncbi:MAG: SpoIIE family protein phosphatase [Crocinitomicaceae bacterium]|nr:SpoIIE family protein phosphatase [Crocinitomicaceae bacterium]
MEAKQSTFSKFENKVWIILLVVLSVVLLSAFFVYRSLTGIVNDITNEARPDEKVLLMKEIMYDLTDAENNVKSYSLTNDVNYLEEFNLNFTQTSEKVIQLKDLSASEKDFLVQVVSLDSLIQKKFLLLEDMLLLRGQSRVTSALDKVSDQIETEAVESNEGVFNNGGEKSSEETAEAEDKFFKKLFDKKKKNEEDATTQKDSENKSEEVHQNEKITLEQINQEILQIKKEEELLDKSMRDKELFLIQEDKKISDEIVAVFVSMENLETLSMEEKLLLADAKSKQTNLLIGLFCLVACALLIFAGYAVNVYVKRNEAFKIALRRAKQETDAKNKEITDSIIYAQKIQEAILPDRKLFSEYLKQSFILYKPKDIVAGDFYWTVKTPSHLFVAVADCTGHGVPGAMVSVVCSTALNRCVREFGLSKPADILDKCRTLVIESFSSGNYQVNDGMDIALISLQKSGSGEMIIEYAGANNSLYIIKNGTLQDVTSDKQPIGNYQYQKPFTNHKIIAEPDTMLYLFSDGFADQFGGPYGKKFKYKQFQEMLISNSGFELNKQLYYLEEKFDTWKGALEQIDDVCVIGIRV